MIDGFGKFFSGANIGALAQFWPWRGTNASFDQAMSSADGRNLLPVAIVNDVKVRLIELIQAGNRSSTF